VHFTGFVNWTVLAVSFPIAMLVTPHGAQLAHWLNKRRMELWLGVFLLSVSARFFWSQVR